MYTKKRKPEDYNNKIKKRQKSTQDSVTQELINIINNNIAEPYQCTRSGVCPDKHGCRSTAFNVSYILSQIETNKSESYEHNQKLYKHIRNELREILCWGKCNETDYIKNIKNVENTFIKPNRVYIIITNFAWLYGINSPYHTFIITTDDNTNTGIIWQSWYDGSDNYVELNKTESININELLDCLKSPDNTECTKDYFTAPEKHTFKNVSTAYIIDYTGIYNKSLCKSPIGGKKKSIKRKRRSKRKTRKYCKK